MHVCWYENGFCFSYNKDTRVPLDLLTVHFLLSKYANADKYIYIYTFTFMYVYK